jgi:hypothetical protein
MIETIDIYWRVTTLKRTSWGDLEKEDIFYSKKEALEFYNDKMFELQGPAGSTLYKLSIIKVTEIVREERLTTPLGIDWSKGM